MKGNFSLGWRQVWLCTLILSVSAMMTTTYGVVAVPLMEEFKTSRMVLMTTMSVISIVTALVSPLFGILLDKYSVRWIMVYGAVSIALGFFLLSFVTEFYQVPLVYGLFMAPAQIAAGTMAATVLLSRWFSDMRGRALGLAITGISVGGFCFPPIIQVLIDTFAWREGMRVFALLLACLTIPAALLVINRPSDRGLFADGAASEPEHADPSRLEAGLSVRAILSDPTFWMLALIFAIFFSGMRGFATNVAPLAADEGVDPALIAYPLSLYSAAGVAAKLGFAAIADRMNPRALLLVALIGAGAAHGCMVFAEQGFAMIALGSILIGLFGGMILPLQSFLIPRIFGRTVVGRVSGLLGVAMFAFNFAAPPLFGLIYDLFGNYDAIFLAYVGLMVVGMLVLPVLNLHPREQTGPANRIT